MTFNERVLSVRSEPLRASEVGILQVNIGYRCNMACKHCHIQAGPRRTEMMDRENIDSVLRVLRDNAVNILDVTGGAPELNPHFRRLIREARGLGCRVIARSNLTVFFEEGQEDLPEFYGEHGVEVVASLPYYSGTNVDRVRGEGTFGKSMEALRRLNSLGFGSDASGLRLDIVYNPHGAFLPPGQASLEQEYKGRLAKDFGVSFNSLYAFANMPMGRFRDFLVRTGNLMKYMDRLAVSFNPSTLDGLMCRHMINVGWDGTLYDCDFNQALGLPVHEDCPRHIGQFRYPPLSERLIVTGEHCYGCTAGQGST
jgi:radical SAM/Cys-rich protein